MKTSITHALIAAVEAELLRRDGGTGEDRAWLAQGLVRRAPGRLWEILRAQDAQELARWPELPALLTTLAHHLLAEGRTREADELVQTARRWQVGIDVAVEHRVAEAYVAAESLVFAASVTPRGLCAARYSVRIGR